jgi:molecular chaperone DnaK
VHGRRVEVEQTTLSEPVAAAVYWLWASRRHPDHRPEEFVGRCVLVCDIGGGTFDLSLVRVAEEEQPLTVIDAANNDVAGDYVTALVMCAAARAFNAAHGTDLPQSAEEMLDRVVRSDETWLRGWFLTAQDMQKRLSVTIAAAANRGRTATRATTATFGDDRRSVELSLTPAEFTGMLEPFYRHGRDLLRGFLDRQAAGDMPVAVVFAGGGSRIAGVRDSVVRPVLAEILPDADQVLSRIAFNERSIDQAIALGAALVANGVVKVEERLLYDVGVVFSVPPTLVEKLGLPEGSRSVVVSPMLPRSARLPARFHSSDHRMPPTGVMPAAETQVRVVIDDDPHDPWVQSWVVPHPAEGREMACDLELSADS